MIINRSFFHEKLHVIYNYCTSPSLLAGGFSNTAEKRLRMRQFYWDWLDESGVSSLFILQYGGEKKYLTYVPLE